MDPECNPDRLKCEKCRTINLADQVSKPKPDMQLYDKCSPTKRVTCARVYELPVHPTCIRICNKFGHEKSEKKLPPHLLRPYYAHGRLMYVVKAAILVGTAYFTYAQGVWGDQQDVTECVRRWQEYMRSINRRRPPDYDQCGNVIMAQSSESLIAPLYAMYKEFVTTCFSGVVKIPLIAKCAYIDYLKALERRQAEIERENKLRRNSAK